jgi:Cu/Ag efflux protein CusF
MISLLLLAAVGVGIAIYANWVYFSKEESADRTQVRMDIDKEKIKKDVATVEKKADQLKEEARDLKDKFARNDHQEQEVRSETVTGKIIVADPEKKQVTVATSDNKTLTMAMTADTQIRLGDKDAKLSDLKAGQQVTCVHASKNGQDVCRSLTVKTPD